MLYTSILSLRDLDEGTAKTFLHPHTAEWVSQPHGWTILLGIGPPGICQNSRQGCYTAPVPEEKQTNKQIKQNKKQARKEDILKSLSWPNSNSINYNPPFNIPLKFQQDNTSFHACPERLEEAEPATEPPMDTRVLHTAMRSGRHWGGPGTPENGKCEGDEIIENQQQSVCCESSRWAIFFGKCAHETSLLPSSGGKTGEQCRSENS